MRIQRMRLCLQWCDLIVKYRRGKYEELPDTPPRVQLVSPGSTMSIYRGTGLHKERDKPTTTYNLGGMAKHRKDVQSAIQNIRTPPSMNEQRSGCNRNLATQSGAQLLSFKNTLHPDNKLQTVVWRAAPHNSQHLFRKHSSCKVMSCVLSHVRLCQIRRSHSKAKQCEVTTDVDKKSVNTSHYDVMMCTDFKEGKSI